MIFPQRNKWTFKPGILSEDVSEISNPSRGWYEIYSFSIADEIDFEELKWCLRENQALALLLIDSGDIADECLSEQNIQNMDRLLRFFSDAKKDIILRLTYDRQGSAQINEPSSFLSILTHINQLGGVLKKYKKAIFTYQGLLIGNWGEMHGSAYISRANIKTLANALYEASGKENYLSVRKPQHWRYIFDDLSMDSFAEQLGLFDDGMFGSDNHLGTFGAESRKKSDWHDSWAIADELKFESRVCENAPNGGEAVLGQNSFSSIEIIERLKAMKVTYLNCAHDKRLLNKWKDQLIDFDDKWNGISCYDYIGLHLGYRIVIENIKLKRRAENMAQAEVKFSNRGFAPLYEDSFFELSILNGNGEVITSTKENNSKIQPGICYEIKLSVPIAAGDLYINLKRKKDLRNICIANTGRDERGVLLGYIVFQH